MYILLRKDAIVFTWVNQESSLIALPGHTWKLPGDLGCQNWGGGFYWYLRVGRDQDDGRSLQDIRQPPVPHQRLFTTQNAHQ